MYLDRIKPVRFFEEADVLYLKRLSLFGFKSFAGKVDMEFSPGVVAIVGPNGCGKSNISDAIRWALGEQSAKPLRGASMQDVIFSGTQNRRGLGFAEVTLVFDNEDKYLPLEYAEVTVTRKLFKSGDSEFYLNGVACRLKDIVDVFLGTGLGKETYSVVEQGRIDAILSLRPEDRRSLFDEAAGIMRFRLRKKEAERKLENVKDNQLRVTDLAQELANQLPVLSIQAETAKRYDDLNQRLQGTELAMCCLKVQETSGELSRLRPAIQELVYRETELNTQISDLESKIEIMKAESANCDKKLEELFVKSSEAAAASQKQEGLLNLLKERAEVLSSRIGSLKEGEAELSAKRQRLQIQAEEALAACEKSGLELADMKAATDRLEEEYSKFIGDMNSCADQVNSLKEELFAIMSDLAQARNERTSILSDRTGFDARIERIKANISNRQELLDGVNVSIAEAEGEKGDASGRLESLKKELEKARLTADELKQTAEMKERKRAEIERELSKTKATYQALCNLEAQHEGYGRAVKSLFGAYDGKKKGLLGVVSEVIKVPEKFEAAIEAALGGAIQNVVALTDDAAQKAVEHLKANRSGRATFLPLNMLSVSRLSQTEIPNAAAGFLGVGCELIECDSRCRRAVEYLLGRVIVASDLKSAASMKKGGFKGKIVTLEGDVISGGGAITGGELSDRQSGLLSRSRKVRELAESIEEKRRELETAESEASELRARYGLQLEAINVIVEKANDCSLKMRSVDEQIRGHLNERDRIEKDISGMHEEISFVEASLEDGKNGLHDVEERIDSLNELYQSKSKLLEDLNVSFAQFKSHDPEMSERLTAAKVGIAEKRAEHSGLMAEKGRIASSISELEAKASESLAEMDSLSTQLEECNRERERANQDAGELSAVCDRLQKEIDGVRSERSSLSDDVKRGESKLKGMRRTQSAVHESLQSKKVEEARLCAEMDSEASKLYNEFTMSVDRALEMELPSRDWQAMRQECEKIRSHISDLGPINHTAVEEYEAVSGRYEFLEEQLKDLQEASSSLLEVIRETEKACKRQFMETFDKINEEFKEVFVKLFGGGEAHLRLEDEDDPLECGIDIICQPPGKKLSSLALLSGGERALTAISLLFAIVKVRPSPFCVLDEIDSALDEGNVNRFADLIKEFSQMIQVILVTHRKGTMECADYLYGVTMEESGVSKVFSVRPE